MLHHAQSIATIKLIYFLSKVSLILISLRSLKYDIFFFLLQHWVAAKWNIPIT